MLLYDLSIFAANSGSDSLHRGQGCAQPARTNTGLTRAAILGMKLLGGDQRLQEAIGQDLWRH
jgi:hypothetical protein